MLNAVVATNRSILMLQSWMIFRFRAKIPYHSFHQRLVNTSYRAVTSFFKNLSWSTSWSSSLMQLLHVSKCANYLTLDNWEGCKEGRLHFGFYRKTVIWSRYTDAYSLMVISPANSKYGKICICSASPCTPTHQKLSKMPLKFVTESKQPNIFHLLYIGATLTAVGLFPA